MKKLSMDPILSTIVVFVWDNAVIVVWGTVLFPKRYILKYLGVKCYNVCNLLSGGSGRGKKYCYLDTLERESKSGKMLALPCEMSTDNSLYYSFNCFINLKSFKISHGKSRVKNKRTHSRERVESTGERSAQEWEGCAPHLPTLSNYISPLENSWDPEPHLLPPVPGVHAHRSSSEACSDPSHSRKPS